MSIETLLGDLIAATKEGTAATVQNNGLLEKLIAGREEALEQLKSAGEPKPATRRRGAKAEEAGEDGSNAASSATAVAGAATTSAAGTKRTADTTDDGIRKLVGEWMGKSGDEKVKKGLTDMLQHFGSPKIVGPDSTLNDEQRYQATFFIARHMADKPVDYTFAYDFDADPLTQGNEPAEAGSDDLIG